MRNKDGLLARRVAMAAVGMALAGVAVGLFKRAMFGVDPYQAFVNGLANVIPIRFGTLYMLVNAIQLVVVFFLDKHYIGISTLINLFLLGYVAEFTELGLARWLGEPTLAGQIAFLIVGIVLSCFAAALYYTADLGVSTYDAIPLHISDRKPRVMGRVLPFRAIRILSDLVCTGVGAALGAPVGLGTVITALFMGPLIAFFRRTVSDPLLEKGRKAA